jgi:hypothetical protein
MNNADAASKQTVDERIGYLERRLEIRRGRIEHDVEEMKERLSQKTTWVPLVAAAGALVLGYAVARAHSGDRSPHGLDVPRRKTELKGGIAATTLGLAAGAARLALSPQGRTLWQAFRRGVTRGRESGRREVGARAD